MKWLAVVSMDNGIYYCKTDERHAETGITENHRSMSSWRKEKWSPVTRITMNFPFLLYRLPLQLYIFFSINIAWIQVLSIWVVCTTNTMHILTELLLQVHKIATTTMRVFMIVHILHILYIYVHLYICILPVTYTFRLYTLLSTNLSFFPYIGTKEKIIYKILFIDVCMNTFLHKSRIVRIFSVTLWIFDSVHG